MPGPQRRRPGDLGSYATGRSPGPAGTRAPARASIRTEVLWLQRHAGNQAVARLVAGAPGAGGRRLARFSLHDIIKPMDEVYKEAHKLLGFDVTATATFDPAGEGEGKTVPGTDWPINRRMLDVPPLDVKPEPELMPIQAGKRGFLTVRAEGAATILGFPTNQVSKMHASETWEVITSKEGAVTIRKLVDKDKDKPTIKGDLTGDAQINLKDAEANESNDTRRVWLAVEFAGPGVGTEKETKERGIGWEGGVEGKEGGGKVSSEGDEETRKKILTNPPGSARYVFVVEIGVTNPQKPPRPVRPEPRPTHRNEWRVWFDWGKSNLSADERRHLIDWWEHGVSAEIKQKLAANQKILHIDSYADATDTVEKNEKLAGERQAAVEKLLSHELGHVEWASAGIHGENKYATDDPKREGREQALRRSVIWFEETVSPDKPPEIMSLAESRRAEEEAAIARQLERSAGKSAGASPRP